MGFFNKTGVTSSKKPLALVPQCGSCGLYQTCLSPKMPVSGGGRRGILVVGESPGETEDRENTQFVGKTGNYLRSVLRDLDVNLDEDCWKTNSLICRPPGN